PRPRFSRVFSRTRTRTRTRTTGQSTVAVGRSEGKRIGKMPHFMRFAVAQEDFHDVEADLYLRLLEQAQIIQRTLGKQPALARIDRSRRAHPVFRRTRLDLHEHQAVVVAKYKVNLSAFRTEIRRQEFQPEFSKMIPRGPLTGFPVTQVKRLRGSEEPRF